MQRAIAQTLTMAGLVITLMILNPQTDLEPIKAVANPNHDAVYKLTNLDLGGSGSAFPIYTQQLEDGTWRTQFMTARHCHQDGIMTVEHHHFGEVGVVSDWIDHPMMDMSLFSVISDFQIPVRKLSFDPVKFGERVLTSGYQYGADIWVHAGVVSTPGLVGTFGAHGCSGGVVSLENGDVIGIMHAHLISGGMRMVPDCAYYVPLQFAEDWVRENLGK